MTKEQSEFNHQTTNILNETLYMSNYDNAINLLSDRKKAVEKEINKINKHEDKFYYRWSKDNFTNINNRLKIIKEYLPKYKEFTHPQPEIFYKVFKSIDNKLIDVFLKTEKLESIKDFLNEFLNKYETNIYKVEFLTRFELYTKLNFDPDNKQNIQQWVQKKKEYYELKYDHDKSEYNTKEKPKTTSFNFTGKQEQLKELYKQLKDGNFIAEETDLKDFEAVFNGVPIDNIKPIKWIDFAISSKQQANIKTVYELLYLLKENNLFKEQFETTRKDKSNIYSKIRYCFKDGINNEIFKHIHNKNPDASMFKPQQKTNRQTKLKTIIQSL